MAEIHPTAIVDPGAQIGEGVSVGPYSIIHQDVELADGCQILSHVVVDGDPYRPQLQGLHVDRGLIHRDTSG